MSNTSKIVCAIIAIGIAININAEIRDEHALASWNIRTAAATVPWRLKEIRHVRAETQACVAYLTGEHWPVSDRTPAGTRYRRWVLNLWRNRLNGCNADTRATRRDPVRALRLVFGPYAEQAIRVARCESNLRPWARNGQYRGIFQMGDYARAAYGHGDDVLEQSKAAYRYFVASGRTWGPWSCKP